MPNQHVIPHTKAPALFRVGALCRDDKTRNRRFSNAHMLQSFRFSRKPYATIIAHPASVN